MVGQDIDAGTRIEFAPAARTAEARRSTEQVKLRLRPEDALRLRAAAAERGLDVSAYVALLLDDPRRPLVPSPSSELQLAEVSRLAGLLGLLPEEVRRSRGGELGRAFGLLKHLFESPASAPDAERHAYALGKATHDARIAIAKVETAIEHLIAELAPIREDLAVAARRLASRP
jgi:hypothetical protein